MKIKNQFIISIIIFIGIFVVISASIFFTSQRVLQLSAQRDIARNIQTSAADLSYLSNDYFLFRDEPLLESWHITYDSIWDEVSKINPVDPYRQTLVENIEADLHNLNSTFQSGLLLIDNAAGNESVLTTSSFQLAWSRLGVQSQALAFEVNLLLQSLSAATDQLQMTNIALIVILLSLFGAYFVINYLVTYRKTLRSISQLQDGLAVIGLGNLDYSIKAGKKDEIGEISVSVNQMIANLKSVTASKLELEKEICERTRAQEALKASEQRWVTTLSSIGDAVIATDLAGKVTFMNNVAEALTGWSLEKAYQRPLSEVFHIINEVTRQEVQNPIERVLESGMIVGLGNHTVLLLEDGTEVPIDDSASPIRGQNGQVIGVVLIFHDITERKQTEQELARYRKRLEQLVEQKTKQLRDAERLAAIGATAGMVGHDIRNPLQAMTSDVYLAKLYLDSVPNGQAKDGISESLDSIEKNVDYVNKIVQDLQDFARPLTPTARETDVELILDDVLIKKAVPEVIRVKRRVDAGAKLIVSDPDLLKRILANLVNNAVQAMPKGGKLDVWAYKEKDDVIITVKDTGVGIPEEVRSKLFTPLFTTKSKGQGFGLAVVKRMTEALGGTVTFESELGEGTKFIVRLPQSNKR